MPIDREKEGNEERPIWTFIWIAFAIATVGWLFVCAYALGAL